MRNRATRRGLLLLKAALALAVLALAWAAGPGSSGADQDAMYNCPQPGRWAISVWSGEDGTDTGQALGTCGEDAVDAAYALDPQTGAWLGWFRGRPEISRLAALDDFQGVLTLGGAGASSATLAAAALPASGRIAFVSERDGNKEIYVMNADGTGQTRLTNNQAFENDPAWSPDGSKIAFGSDRDGNGEIYVMNADGTGQTRLTNNSAEEWYPAWSPDGSKIAFQSDRDGNGEIYVMNANGTGQTRLTNNPAEEGAPAWSPDGSKIAFFSDRDGGVMEVYVMNANGTGQTNLTNNPAWDRGADWSPDGSQIVFHSDRNGDPMEVYVMKANGTDQTRLTNNPAYDGYPSWSPDGSQIAFQSDRDGNLEVYVMNADGTGQTNLTNSPALDMQAVWSPAQAQQGTMHNCPQPGKWAISVWGGQDGTDASQALATCGQNAVDAAYALDAQTGGWLGWFHGRPEISRLATVDYMQGLIVVGGSGAPATPTPSPTPVPTSTTAPTTTPAPTATASPTRTPTPTPTPGPTGPIVFRGWVVDGPTMEEPMGGPCGWWWWVIEVEIDEVIKMEQEEGLCGFYDYVPGETIDVRYFAANPPDVAIYDYVEVSGEESMFSCGCVCCCDGCGLIVDPDVTGHYIRQS